MNLSSCSYTLKHRCLQTNLVRENLFSGTMLLILFFMQVVLRINTSKSITRSNSEGALFDRKEGFSLVMMSLQQAIGSSCSECPILKPYKSNQSSSLVMLLRYQRLMLHDSKAFPSKTENPTLATSISAALQKEKTDTYHIKSGCVSSYEQSRSLIRDLWTRTRAVNEYQSVLWRLCTERFYSTTSRCCIYKPILPPESESFLRVAKVVCLKTPICFHPS